MNDLIIWNLIENNTIRQLHKLKTRQIAYLLSIFDEVPMRGTRELFSKLITILPIHVEYLSPTEFTKVFEICLNNNLGIYT